MSILIKGMEMPQYCGSCHIGFCKQIGCDLYIGFDDYATSRHPDCPIRDVPPHGDLIDKKNLSDDLQRRWNVSDDQDFCNKEVWHALEEAPTIIEAEEET